MVGIRIGQPNLFRRSILGIMAAATEAAFTLKVFTKPMYTCVCADVTVSVFKM